MKLSYNTGKSFTPVDFILTIESLDELLTLRDIFNLRKETMSKVILDQMYDKEDKVSEHRIKDTLSAILYPIWDKLDDIVSIN